jgi:dTMP kinase
VPDKFESQPVAFFERVAAGYAARALAAPQRFARINADLDRALVWQQLAAAVVQRGYLTREATP